MLLWGSKKNRVVGVSLDMLLEILGALEGLATEVTFVRLQRHVDSDVRSNVVTLDGGGSARVPSASEVQVVCALSSDMLLTDMFKEGLSGGASLRAFVPLAREVIIGSDSWARSLRRSSAGGSRIWLGLLRRHGQ
jgi:hypothetical protein